MVLSHVVTLNNAVHGIIWRKNQAPLDAVFIVDSALQAQRIKRKVFERFLYPINIGSKSGSELVDFFRILVGTPEINQFERITQVV